MGYTKPSKGKRFPPSEHKPQPSDTNRIAAGAIGGAILGGALGGPPGLVIGLLAGAFLVDQADRQEKKRRR